MSKQNVLAEGYEPLSTPTRVILLPKLLMFGSHPEYVVKTYGFWTVTPIFSALTGDLTGILKLYDRDTDAILKNEASSMYLSVTNALSAFVRPP